MIFSDTSYAFFNEPKTAFLSIYMYLQFWDGRKHDNILANNYWLSPELESTIA